MTVASAPSTLDEELIAAADKLRVRTPLVVGGRSAAYEQSLAQARETAIGEMMARARDLGGNAIVGVDLDYEVINNMLMVSASGTAVTVE